MYITAQRVRSSSRGAREGVNAFFNLHGETETVAENWDDASLERFVEANPGTLVDQLCDVPPGGNRVRSYLDIVTADATEVESVHAALDAFESYLAVASSLPLVSTLQVTTLERVTLRFDAELALVPEMHDEYRTLKARVIFLLDRWVYQKTRKVASSGG